MEMIKYVNKIEIKDGRSYMDVISYLGQTAFGSMVSLNQKTRIYYLNEGQDKIIRVNDKRRTIEFNDKVEQNTIDTINSIKETEKVLEDKL